MTAAWLARRLLAMLCTLLGITVVTFAALDLVPVDRATVQALRAGEDGGFVDAKAREVAILRLRAHYGLVDPVTFAPEPLPTRYLAWLQRAVQLDFGGAGDDGGALWSRVASALPVTSLLGGLALLLAFTVGVPLGVRAGVGAGSRAERWLGRVLLAGNAVPDYLFGSLLLLLFAGWHWQWLPSHGLTSPGSADWGMLARLGDLALHLILPVLTLALGPLVLVMRFVRDATARAAAQPFAQQLHALGLPPERIRQRLRRHALVPLATLAGGLLPMLVGGSVVVESLFSLDGIGQLAFAAVRDLDHAMVMLLTVIGAIVTLLALFVSDVLHRLIDPRVRFVA